MGSKEKLVLSSHEYSDNFVLPSTDVMGNNEIFDKTCAVMMGLNAF